MLAHAEKSSDQEGKKSKEKDKSKEQDEYQKEAVYAWDHDLPWLQEVLTHRIAEMESNAVSRPLEQLEGFEAPMFENQSTPYAKVVEQYNLSKGERLLLTTAMLPHFNPSLLSNMLIHEESSLQVKYKGIGGFVERPLLQFHPTLQTAQFLWSGAQKQKEQAIQHEILSESVLFKEGILSLEALNATEVKGNLLHQALILAPEYRSYFQTGELPRPDFGEDFPARMLESKLDWDDLVLNFNTRRELEEIMHWVEHGKKLLDLDPRINASFPVLFHGPPGTGKSLAAALIGKQLNRPVFKVDLSLVVSKYIGETEKNLEKLFTRADGKDWILFFDEADTLFSRRTGVSDSNDKWANNEVAYLLQRMETYTGLCVLASNMKSNLDPAMRRRFQAVVHFPSPTIDEKKQLWSQHLPKGFEYADDVRWDTLHKQNLTGANIANILKLSALSALNQETTVLRWTIINRVLMKELQKEERTMIS